MQKQKCHLKLNDQVEVLTGKDKGRVGKIIKIDRERGRAVVEKLNVIKRHTKPSAMNQQGGIIEKEASMDLSNLMLICPKCAKTVRVGKKTLEDGTRVRVCKKCNESVEAKA